MNKAENHIANRVLLAAGVSIVCVVAAFLLALLFDVKSGGNGVLVVKVVIGLIGFIAFLADRVYVSKYVGKK